MATAQLESRHHVRVGRREMRRAEMLAAHIACVVLIALLMHVPATAADRPNVILIYTDDQGSTDVGCYGARDLTTPWMDRIAARGIRFTQFYAAAPVCSPSRAALLTGRTPQRAGVPGNVSSARGHAGMPAAQHTIAELLGGAGYDTAHIGKWHLGYTPETMPNGQGFTYSFGHMGGCIDNYSHFFYWNGPNRHDLWRNGSEVWQDGAFFPQLIADEAVQFIQRKREAPFFLYWAINLPHYPLQGLGRWRAHYKNLKSPRREYAAFISTMDQAIGELLQAVDHAGLQQNTIIVFQSDHGHSTEVRTFGGGGSAGPYRGAKFSLFEGGIRVPAMISWPGHLPQNVTRSQMATACDWYPTIAQLCGVPLPQHALDGASLVPVLNSADAPSPHQTFHWQTGKNQWAVRQGDWKLIGNPRDTSNKAPLGPGDRLFLSHLGRAVDELKNLAPEHPDVVERLRGLHEQWVRDRAAR